MKKQFFFAAVALVALASCADKEYVGDSPTPNPDNGASEAIVFNSGTKTATRADYYGQAAAEKLNNKFIVGGFKGATGTSTVFNATTGVITTEGVPATTTVFDNYQVLWKTNSAGTTESNSSDWEYAGVDKDGNTIQIIAPATASLVGHNQSIKYWDYSADQYDFIAYSTSDASVITSGDPTGSQVLVSAISAANAGKSASGAYTLKGGKDGLKKCYIADMVTIYKDGTDDTKYRDVVNLTFRSLTSKVRVAFYETIPGYAVKDVRFYTNGTTYLGVPSAKNEGDEGYDESVTYATLFAPTGTEANNYFYSAGQYTVYFPTIGKDNVTKSDYNKAHVAFIADDEGKAKTMSFNALDYQTAPRHHEGAEGSKWLARNSANATFAGTSSPDNYYQIALPNEVGTVLELRVDYTLVSEDGSGETIKIYGATAYVPAIYAAWKPNYAYTYLFKISDNTNGWTHKVDGATNTIDPAGLYPITFDAIVLETEDNTQSTITNVSTPSITTYQKGHDYTQGTAENAGSKEYTAAKGDIYVQVYWDGATPALRADLESNGQLYTLSDATATEAEVLDALNIQMPTAASGYNITGRNDLSLKEETSDATIVVVPGADGNNITVTAGTAAKFTPAAGTYAYVYDTNTYASDYYPTEPAGWPTGYYTDATCGTAATGTFSAGTYYRQSSTIGSYVELVGAAPSDWNSSDNVYYSDEACTTKITAGYTSLHKLSSGGTEPDDWNETNNVYYTDTECTTPANEAFDSGKNYFKKVKCYRKYTVNNKVYGVKVIKVV